MWLASTSDLLVQGMTFVDRSCLLRPAVLPASHRGTRESFLVAARHEISEGSLSKLISPASRTMASRIVRDARRSGASCSQYRNVDKHS